MLLLEATNLHCQRGERILYAGLRFELNAGQVLQVQGPNGAGKSTLLRQLCGLHPLETGHIHWSAPQSFLYIGHRLGFKAGLRCWEQVYFTMKLLGSPVSAVAVKSAMKAMGLASLIDVNTEQLSAGQSRRLVLTRCCYRRQVFGCSTSH